MSYSSLGYISLPACHVQMLNVLCNWDFGPCRTYSNKQQAEKHCSSVFLLSSIPHTVNQGHAIGEQSRILHHSLCGYAPKQVKHTIGNCAMLS